jgi:hypothetical protein
MQHYKVHSKCSQFTHDNVDPQDLARVLSVEDLHAEDPHFQAAKPARPEPGKQVNSNGKMHHASRKGNKFAEL